MFNESDSNREPLIQLGFDIDIIGGPNPLMMGWHFRKLNDHYRRKYEDIGLDDKQEPFRALNVVLKNNLVLDRGLNIVGEDESASERPTSPDNFLCASLADEDLPWGNESDW